MEVTIVDILFISVISISTLIWYKVLETKRRIDKGEFDEVLRRFNNTTEET